MLLSDLSTDEEESNFSKNIDCNSSKPTSQHPRTSSLAASQHASQPTLSRSKKPTTKTSVNLFKNRNYSMAARVYPTTAPSHNLRQTHPSFKTLPTSSGTSQNFSPVSF